MRTFITSDLREGNGCALTNGSHRAEGESRASVLRALLRRPYRPRTLAGTMRLLRIKAARFGRDVKRTTGLEAA